MLARPLEVFVKVNTGMNRLGFRPADVAGVCQRLASSPSVAALRLMMHFARADEDDGIEEPLAVFEAACQGLPYPRSLANSAGIVRFPEVGGDIVRPGIMLYGATPFPYDTADMLGLQAGDDAALGAHRRAGTQGQRQRRATARPTPRRGRIASASSRAATPTAIRATRRTARRCSCAASKVRLAGRPSMDMLTVDLTDVPEARVGSPVVLWGEGLPVDDVANAASTVGYELLCAVAPRVPHVTSELGGIDLEL